MKGIFGLVGLLCVGVFVMNVMFHREVTKDQGQQIAIAFGIPNGDRIQVHLGVAPMVPVRDPLDADKEHPLTEMEWLEKHYQLYDSNGESVQLLRMGTSGLMIGEKAAGVPEFVVWAEVKKGEDYTFDFVPILKEGTTYRWKFTAPMEEKKVGRPTFVLVEEEAS